MATSKDYLAFVLEQLSDLDGITHRMMMGEYMIYYNGKIAAYLCDDRLLVKPVQAALALMPDAKFEPPYEGAKDMILVENLDDRAFLTELLRPYCQSFPCQSPRKKEADKRSGSDEI